MVFKAYTLQMSTLFLSVSLLNKFIDSVNMDELDLAIPMNIAMTKEEKLKLVTLIILSISAKY